MDTSVPVYHPHTNQVSVSTRRLPAEIARGLRDVAPLLIGIIPFGLVAGAAAVESGLRPSQAVGLSVIVFAGASQLAVIDLLGQNATLSIAVITGVVINLRILMYSASIAPHFSHFVLAGKQSLHMFSLIRHTHSQSRDTQRKNSQERNGVDITLLLHLPYGLYGRFVPSPVLSSVPRSLTNGDLGLPSRSYFFHYLFLLRPPVQQSQQQLLVGLLGLLELSIIFLLISDLLLVVQQV